ncbi:MAG: DMT family transporter [Lachnospiraceae bacterium]|nr:DMT family transporter [Lachnospiraceae bacterium]
MKKNEARGIVYLLLTAIIWGGSFISQLFGGEILGPFSFTAYRCIFGCAAIFIMIVVDNFINYRVIKFFRPTENIILTIKNSLWCGIVLFLGMVTQQIGVQLTDTAKAGLIASLEAVVVPLMLLILYKRKIRIITWIFIFTAMIGIMLLSSHSVSGFNIGDVWVFVSTILYSLTIIQVPKYAVNVDPLKFSFFRFVAVGVLGMIFALIFKEKPFDGVKIVEAMPSMLYSGILASGVAYTFQILGQRDCEPIIATLLMSLEGIFAAILGWIILGQSLNFIQILGILVAFISIVFVQITDNHT